MFCTYLNPNSMSWFSNLPDFRWSTTKCSNVRDAEQWQHAKHSTYLRVNSNIWIMWCQYDQRRNKPLHWVR